LSYQLVLPEHFGSGKVLQKVIIRP